MAADIVDSYDSPRTDGPEQNDADENLMTPVQRRQRNKNLKDWKKFIDFLFRHISVVAYKYNCFERDKLKLFMSALERSELLSALYKLKKRETSKITGIVKMKVHANMLDKERYLLEADVVRTYIDLVARMRDLSTIASGLFKALRRAKLQRLDLIKYTLDHWRGFCVRTFDYSQLVVRNIDTSTLELDDTGLQYIAWPAALRTSIHLAQTFLKRVCDSTGLVLIDGGDVRDVMSKHMQTNEIILAMKMKEMLFEQTESRKVAVTRSALQDKRLAEASNDHWTMPSLADVDAFLIRPIDDCGILLALPEVPVKEAPRKKRRRRKSNNVKNQAPEKQRKTKNLR